MQFFLVTVTNGQDYMVSKMEKGPKGQANLIVFCHKGLRSLRDDDQPRSESKLLERKY